MDHTAAERQRRYRRHKAGDHSLCDPSRDCATTAVTVTPSVTAPRLGPAGRQLWRELNGDQADGAVRVLTVEACRITDRLDRFDAILSGSALDWLAFVADRGDPDRQEVVIDKPLAEARQQATALKQILSELRQAAAGGKQASKPAATEGAVSGVISLAAEVAKRRPSATG